MKTYGRVDVQTHYFSPCHHSFTPRPPELQGKIPGTHWIGGEWGPRADLDDMEKSKFLSLPGLELDLSVVQPVTSGYTELSRLPGGSDRDQIKVLFQNLPG
jgi:hypothetical protein